LLLKQTIQSVVQQSYEDWEIIIVDDGSDELEWKKIVDYSSEKVRVLQRKDGLKGPSRCRNLGASVAAGKYLLFLDSDDLLAEFCLAQRVSQMQGNDTAGMCIFLMKEFHTSPGDSSNIYNTVVPEHRWSAAFLANCNPWNVTCPLWTKSFFQKIGGFNERLFFMEDPEIHLRAINQKGAIIKLCYHLPADSYYRVNHIDHTKGDFWYNSIFYRLQFYKILLENQGSLLNTYRTDVKKGVYQLVKTFLYHRKNQFPELFNELVQWMKKSGLFSAIEIARIYCLTIVGNYNSPVLKKLKVKGICYSLLPRS